jgi:hypothetical protein
VDDESNNNQKGYLERNANNNLQMQRYIKFAQNNSTGGDVLLKTTKLILSSEEDKMEHERTISIDVTDASYTENKYTGGTLSQLSLSCLDFYTGEDGLRYLGLCNILNKFLRAFRSPTYTKKEKMYTQFIVILNFAKNGMLNRNFYNALNYQGISNDVLNLNMYVKMMDAIRLSINKLRTVAPQYHGSHFIFSEYMSYDESGEYDVDEPITYNGNDSMDKMKIKRKYFINRKKNILEIPILEQKIIDSISHESDINIDNLKI